MRPYGLPRNDDVAHPDCADIGYYALKSAAGSLRGKGGDHRGNHKNKASKAASRRFFKKAARRAAKAAIDRDWA